MAGAHGAPRDVTADWLAWKAGTAHRPLSKSLADLEGEDPSIAPAYAAGNAGTPYEQIGAGPTATPSPGPEGNRGTPGTPGGRGPASKSSGGSRSSRAPAKAGRAPARKRSSTGARTPSGRRRRLPAPRLTDPRAPLAGGPGPVAHAGAGVVLGMVFYALVLSVIDYGPTGPLLWFKAKFLNEAVGGSGSSSTDTTLPATAQGGASTNQASPPGTAVITPTGPGGSPGDIVPSGPGGGAYTGPGAV